MTSTRACSVARQRRTMRQLRTDHSGVHSGFHSGQDHLSIRWLRQLEQSLLIPHDAPCESRKPPVRSMRANTTGVVSCCASRTLSDMRTAFTSTISRSLLSADALSSSASRVAEARTLDHDGSASQSGFSFHSCDGAVTTHGRSCRGPLEAVGFVGGLLQAANTVRIPRT